jgi:hypothetical protein
MPVTKIGLVYYADDPDKKIFRRVFPTLDDSELDGPPTDGECKPMLFAPDVPHSWASFGTDPARIAVMVKVPADSPLLALWPSGAVGDPPTSIVSADVLAAIEPLDVDAVM